MRSLRRLLPSTATFADLNAMTEPTTRLALVGVALLGDAHAENERVIAAMGRARVLGRLPRLTPLTPESLARACSAAFALEPFLMTETSA